jgi:imidazolonepropionase-like amidohydrolase
MNWRDHFGSRELVFQRKFRSIILWSIILSIQFSNTLLQTQASEADTSSSSNASVINHRELYTAARLFDGENEILDGGVLIEGAQIVKVGPAKDLSPLAENVFELGDATLLPGFIELHAHLLFQHIPAEIVLKHGITTLRDVGGPLKAPSGGLGELRLLTAGPIITVQNGYPISIFGKGYIAEPVNSQTEATALVRKLVAGGAAVIKIALEPGGEAGAPWNSGHHSDAAARWPMPSLDLTKAIVDEAHKLGKIVTAHIGDDQGAKIALEAKVDEWAHIPCAEIADETATKAGQMKIHVVTTLDTMSHCHGVYTNARKLSRSGVTFLYGAEVAHQDIPWGIDAQELGMMSALTGMSHLEVLKAATSAAGRELGLSPLGSLKPGAPADLIATRGNAMKNFKLLEYPSLVISGGKVVVNDFGPPVKNKPH